jgi:hypothetical protein
MFQDCWQGRGTKQAVNRLENSKFCALRKFFLKAGQIKRLTKVQIHASPK